MIPPVGCTPKYFKGCKTAGVGEESHDSDWQAEMALSSCCFAMSHSWAEGATGSHWDLLMSASVSPTSWGCHHAGPLCTSTVLLPVVWYRPGIRMEGLEKCACCKSLRLHLKIISSFNKHVCSCFSDRNCQLGSRENSAFIHIFNIGLSHTKKIPSLCVVWKW